MIKWLKQVVRDFFTCPNNEHFEAGRFLWFVSVLAAIGYAGAHLWMNGEFSIVEFGGGMAALIAAGGWGVGAKDRAASEARGEPAS